ncbi:MAG: Maf family protein [Verrucomicrobiota bacterium]|nr:Maf family protein [Verrucomicrobiota bacterium]
MAPPFVLASGSPRRRHLLSEAGFKFEVVSPAVAESSSAALTIRELTICNATRKAMVVARARPDAVVLGADTLVALKRSVIGKPASLREAAAMIRRLSGREHQVCTGVFICSGGGRWAISFCVVSHVLFRALETEEISAYLAKINPLDKAGGYAAQGHGSDIISRIRGSYTNVVGLPMGETLRELRGFGITAGSVRPRRS